MFVHDDGMTLETILNVAQSPEDTDDQSFTLSLTDMGNNNLNLAADTQPDSAETTTTASNEIVTTIDDVTIETPNISTDSDLDTAIQQAQHTLANANG